MGSEQNQMPRLYCTRNNCTCSVAGLVSGFVIRHLKFHCGAQSWCTTEPPHSYLMLMNPSPRGEGPTTTPSAMSPVDHLYFRGYPGESSDIEDCRMGNGNFPEQKGTQLGAQNWHNTAQKKLKTHFAP